jgi:hypothetical protein
MLGGAAVLVVGVCLASCVRFRSQMAGNVKDVDGKAVADCRVELLVRRELLGVWTGYVSREAVTNPAGAFSFDVFAPSRSSFRIRVTHPDHQEWVLESPSPRIPNYVHVTLRRVGGSAEPVGRSSG